MGLRRDLALYNVFRRVKSGPYGVKCQGDRAFHCLARVPGTGKNPVSGFIIRRLAVVGHGDQFACLKDCCRHRAARDHLGAIGVQGRRQGGFQVPGQNKTFFRRHGPHFYFRVVTYPVKAGGGTSQQVQSVAAPTKYGIRHLLRCGLAHSLQGVSQPGLALPEYGLHKRPVQFIGWRRAVGQQVPGVVRVHHGCKRPRGTVHSNGFDKTVGLCKIAGAAGLRVEKKRQVVGQQGQVSRSQAHG